ncbi:potassium channel protein [Bacillus tianshenii]|nr:potassium channel protein [Bacillus tianshenii]
MREYRQVIAAFVGVTAVMLIGTIGFHYLEGMTFFDSLWLTVITVLTVGYGDLSPQTTAGKTFTLFLVPLGVGVATYGVGSFGALILEGRLKNTFGRKRMDKKIHQLEGHVIVCGIGRVGRQVLKQLERQDIEFVIVDRDEELLERYRHGHLYVTGDATRDDILKKAGIEQASGLIATLPADAENVFITLTAKGLNPKIKVVSRIDREESEEKLFRAGADQVVNTSSIGGSRMALSLMKPNSVEYMDVLFETGNKQYSVEEIIIEEQSIIVGKTLGDSNIRDEHGVTIVAIKRGDEILTHPSSDDRLLAGDLVIVFGARTDLDRFEKVLTS